MADFQSCYFPILDGKSDSSSIWHSVSVPLHDAVDLHSKSKQLDVSPLSFLQMAWAVVLRCYLGSNSLIFGCAGLEKTADRNEENAGFDESVHLTCCRIVLEDDYTVLKSLKAIPGDSLAGFVSKSANSLSKLTEDGLAMASSFNTALMYQIFESECLVPAVKFSITKVTQKLSKVSRICSNSKHPFWNS